MRRRNWVAGALLALVAAGLIGFGVSEAVEQGRPPAAAGLARRAYWRVLGIRTARLQLRVVDAITQQGIPGAGCVVAETGDRVEADANGVAPPIDAPIFRNARYEQMLAELHGQLTVICYKKGYRDAIHIGVRMHEGVETEPDIWMFPIGTGDRRVEPTLYQMPIHRLWRIRLTDRFRLFDEGEGPERPQLSNPDPNLVAPQEPMGIEPQTPIRPGGVQMPVPLVPTPPAPTQ